MIFKKLYNHPEVGDYFELDLDSKVIVLLGRNGDGKTTMLQAIEEELKDTELKVINDDARDRGDDMNNLYDPEHIVSTRFSSEGETLIHTIGIMMGKMGAYRKKNKKVVLCLDKVDSGLSYDRIKEVTDFIKSTLVDEAELIVISANSYELANEFRDVAKFIWVLDKKYIELPKSYEEFIKLYMEDRT